MREITQRSSLASDTQSFSELGVAETADQVRAGEWGRLYVKCLKTVFDFLDTTCHVDSQNPTN
jgi:hypothetical protein